MYDPWTRTKGGDMDGKGGTGQRVIKEENGTTVIA